MTDEQPLTGGNATADAVVRVGDTVRKPWLPETPAVQDYLRSLHAAGIDVPAAFGRDDRGRQVVEYVPGTVAMDLGALDPPALRRVGALVRAIHDHSPAASGSDDWPVLLPPPDPPELVCHNDLAPWNLVVDADRDRWVFIDWDGAGPSTRVWDLAYSAQAFALLVEGEPPAAAAARLAAFVDGYAPDRDDPVGRRVRAALPELLGPRTRAMADLLEQAARTGRQPWARMFHDGHGAHWAAAADYVERHRAVWRDALDGAGPESE